VFWCDCKHAIVSGLLRPSKRAIMYMGLWHTWSLFSSPFTNNKKMFLDVEYEDGKKELINLFDYESMKFFNRAANSFDVKYAENLSCLIEVRTNFVYYLKNYIEKYENKKIKKIEFICEFKKIELWGPNLNCSNFCTLSSHNF
jgi:hypothetical protein